MLERIVNSFREAKQFVKDGFGVMFYPMFSVVTENRRFKYFGIICASGMPLVLGYFFYKAVDGDLPAAVFGAGIPVIIAYELFSSYKKHLKPNLNTAGIVPEDLKNEWNRKFLEIYARRNGRLAEYKSVLEGLAASG